MDKIETWTDTFTTQKLVYSIGNSDTEILKDIMRLYNIKQFDLDATYSKGIFYKNIPKPILKYDLNPQLPDVIKANCCNLPIANNKLKSIVFDPPFMFGTHGKTKDNIMNKRFTMFDTFEELEMMYRGALSDFYRVLENKGVLIFKCQDYTDSKTTMTHCLIWKWAMEQGFYAKDIFILINKSRIFNPYLKQRHSRKAHSYYWILVKEAKK